MDHIQHRSVEKIVKMLERGLDPNFHDLDTGGRSRAERTSVSLTEVQTQSKNVPLLSDPTRTGNGYAVRGF